MDILQMIYFVCFIMLKITTINVIYYHVMAGESGGHNVDISSSDMELMEGTVPIFSCIGVVIGFVVGEILPALIVYI